MRRTRWQLSLVLALAAGMAGAAEVWRWTDADGKVRYGQVPPPGVQAERMGIQSRATDKTRVQEELTELELRERTATLTRELNAEQAAAAEAKARASAKACADARSRYETLLSSRLIVVEDPKAGERVVTGEDAEARKEAARRKVEELCGK